MGLLLSVLVGCVGVLELLACLRHASDSVVISINPPTPCLSYHEPADNDIQSIHDSLCSFSHSIIRLPRDARHKLENLHEYSLKVRNELRSLDRNFDGRSTLSECSTRYLLGGFERPDSRLSPDSRYSPDFSYLIQEDDETWIVQTDRHYNDDDDGYIDTKRFLAEINMEIRESLQQVARSLAAPEPKKYVRIPTPIPFVHEENKISASSSEMDTSFDKDSGNEAPTMRSFDDFSIIKRYKDSQSPSSVDESEHEERKIARRAPRKSPSKSPDLSKKSKNIDTSNKMKKLANDFTTTDSAVCPAAEKNEIEKKTFVSQKKSRSGKSSTTILRKPTRLKSRNAEISKSVENLSTKKSKRHNDPERRKSDISVQTVHDLLRDMSTNTSPTNSPSLSRSESKKSISVEVQTVLEDILLDDDALEELVTSVIGFSESRKDLSSRGSTARKSFKNKRFRSSSRDQSDDQDAQLYTAINAIASVERSRREKTKALKVSRFENASEEDYEKIRDVIFDSSRGSSTWRQKENSISKSSYEEDDDEFVDAEDVSSGKPPIQYTIPDTDQNKAFWVIHLTIKVMYFINA